MLDCCRFSSRGLVIKRDFKSQDKSLLHLERHKQRVVVHLELVVSANARRTCQVQKKKLLSSGNGLPSA